MKDETQQAETNMVLLGFHEAKTTLRFYAARPTSDAAS
jgi:hypothetical protein